MNGDHGALHPTILGYSLTIVAQKEDPIVLLLVCALNNVGSGPSTAFSLVIQFCMAKDRYGSVVVNSELCVCLENLPSRFEQALSGNYLDPVEPPPRDVHLAILKGDGFGPNDELSRKEERFTVVRPSSEQVSGSLRHGL